MTSPRRPAPTPRRILPALLAVAVLPVTAAAVVAARPAAAAVGRPVVTGLSAHSGPYWGGRTVTVRGRNLDGATSVRFGSTRVSVRSAGPTSVTVSTPWHDYATVAVTVTGPSGTSAATSAARYTFAHPGPDDPIQGGLTERQEQAAARAVQARHRTPATAARATHWTTPMGTSAARRAASWIGMPYAWAGGNAHGPTWGVCAHNGGDLDCHVTGFDCSGLTLYAWAPYTALAHYTVSQLHQAGRFHPTVDQLVPGDLVFFSGVGHVGIYVGDGQMVDAPMSGETVRSTTLAGMIQWDGWSGAVRPLSTGRQGAVPVLSALGDRVPLDGGTVTLHGRHLAGAVTIDVGGVAVHSVLRRSDTALTVRLPAHAAGAVTVTVSTAWGTTQRRAVVYTAAVTTVRH